MSRGEGNRSSQMPFSLCVRSSDELDKNKPCSICLARFYERGRLDIEFHFHDDLLTPFFPASGTRSLVTLVLSS